MALLINDNCTACDACKPVCPNDAIRPELNPANVEAGAFAAGSCADAHPASNTPAANVRSPPANPSRKSIAAMCA